MSANPLFDLFIIKIPLATTQLQRYIIDNYAMPNVEFVHIQGKPASLDGAQLCIQNVHEKLAERNDSTNAALHYKRSLIILYNRSL